MLVTHIKTVFIKEKYVHILECGSNYKYLTNKSFKLFTVDIILVTI